jgi:hypothetical protein
MIKFEFLWRCTLKSRIMVSDAGQSDRYFVGLLTVELAPFFEVKQSENCGWIYVGCRRDDCQIQKDFRRFRKIAKNDY